MQNWRVGLLLGGEPLPEENISRKVVENPTKVQHPLNPVEELHNKDVAATSVKQEGDNCDQQVAEGDKELRRDTVGRDERVYKISKGSPVMIRKWLREFENSIQTLGVEKEIGIKILPLFQKGEAKGKFYKLSQEQVSTWENVVVHFANAFDTPENRHQVQFQLTIFRQNRLSLREYTNRIRELGEFAYKDFPEEFRDNLLRNHFINQANDYLRELLFKLDPIPQKFADTILIAEELQTLAGAKTFQESDDRLEKEMQKMSLKMQHHYGKTNYQSNPESGDHPHKHQLAPKIKVVEKPSQGYKSVKKNSLPAKNSTDRKTVKPPKFPVSMKKRQASYKRPKNHRNEKKPVVVQNTNRTTKVSHSRNMKVVSGVKKN